MLREFNKPRLTTVRTGKAGIDFKPTLVENVTFANDGVYSVRAAANGSFKTYIHTNTINTAAAAAAVVQRLR